MQSTVQFVLRPKFQAVHQNRSVIFCQSFSKWHHTEEKNVNVIFFADCWSVMTTAVWYFVSRDLVSLFVDRQQAAQHFEKLLTIRFRAHNVRIIHILRTSYTYDTSHSQPKYKLLAKYKFLYAPKYWITKIFLRPHHIGMHLLASKAISQLYSCSQNGISFYASHTVCYFIVV